ncbi:MAG: hypothetical protein AAGF91_05425 [Actinomycetota bacterium]
MRRSRLAKRSAASIALVAALVTAGCVSEADDGTADDIGVDIDPPELDVDELDLDELDLDELDVDIDVSDLDLDDLDAGNASLGAASGAELSDEENQCLDRGAIDVLGTDRFIELSRADFGTDVFLEPGEAEQVSDVFFDCVDANDFLQRTFAADPTFAQLPTEFVDCVLGAIDESVLRSGLAATFSGADATGAALEEAGAEAGFACIDQLTPEQLQDLADL